MCATDHLPRPLFLHFSPPFNGVHALTALPCLAPVRCLPQVHQRPPWALATGPRCPSRWRFGRSWCGPRWRGTAGLQAHQHELDDWVVSLKYGLVLQRPQYALRGRTSAAHFAQRYMEEYALVRRQHPRPPCRCDRCDGAVAAAGEELLARLHMRMLPVLAGAGGYRGQVLLLLAAPAFLSKNVLRWAA